MFDTINPRQGHSIGEFIGLKGEPNTTVSAELTQFQTALPDS